mmetsp:Transcript_7800/g.16288  ORF Transcript_7800/g.16288 Transcript_7800/m.16288 type:complete len:553 (+) Transcript_7800:204-1862(+)
MFLPPITSRRRLDEHHQSCAGLAQGMVTGFTWLSGILCFLLIVTELNRKKFRDFPQNLPLIFASVALCFNLSLGIGPAVEFRQVDEFKTSDFWHTVCLGQSFLYQFCGVATLFWYVSLTNLMYKIIAKNQRIAELRENQYKYYLAGFIIPTAVALVPVIFDAYGPRSGDLECWLDDWHWQLGCMYAGVGVAAFWGAYRSYFIVKVLRRTAYKTSKNRERGAMESKRGHTVMSTLKEHMIRQVAFVFLYVIFALINLVYFTWSSVARDASPGAISFDEPCVLTLMYAVNTSLIGTYISLVFGVTRENVKAARYYYRKWRNPDSSALEPWSTSDLTSPMVEAGSDQASGATAGPRQMNAGVDLEAGLAANLAKAGKKNKLKGKGLAGPATSLTHAGKAASANVVKTHLGTAIDARLGIINSPAGNCASLFDPRAVSGTSVPPLNHPMTAKLEAMRDKYTRNVLAYVLERIEVLALDESIARRFMEEITTESHILFDSSVYESKYTNRSTLGGDETDGDYTADLPSEGDLDEKLAKAKARFEEVVRQESRDVGQG